jgi:hypothetical protein
VCFSRRFSVIVLAAAMLGLGLISPAGATTTTGPVLAGLSITPSTTTVGNTIQVTGTATNTTGSTIAYVSMGVHSPMRAVKATGTGGCTPRNLSTIIYCGVSNLAPGATATLTFTATPTASGTFNYDSYARIAYTNDDTFAYAALTVT